MSTDTSELALRCFHRTITLQTLDVACPHDLTDEAHRFIDDCAVDAGLLIAHSLHTTAGLLLNERETGLQADFRALADALIPHDRGYQHDNMSVRWENLCQEDLEAPNGHAHLRHAMFGTPAIVLPVTEGRVVLGTWQRILLVEYDRPRRRHVFFQALAVPGSSLHIPVDDPGYPNGAPQP